MSPNEHPVTVLLVDDQAIVGEAVRRMFAGEANLEFHFCSDPAKAIEKANEVAPTVILQDLVMPDIDGLTLVKFYRANAATREVPLIVLSTKEEPAVKAQAFATGANDYLVKLPDKLELIARVRYHSKGYVAQIERNEAYRKLAESEKQLADEVAQAAHYVESLLPPPLRQGPVRLAWRFTPSTQLGGDSFGYQWLDDDHFAFYLLDVSGHGVGASLLSVSAMNVLGSRSLPNTDFRQPGQVLAALNNAFPMEKHNGKYFTMWYAVYQKSTRRLAYGGAGHPPLLLRTGNDRSAPLKQLMAQNVVIGMLEGMDYDAETVELGPFAQLLLFSDGVFEIARPDGTMWKFEEFTRFVDSLPDDESALDQLLQQARTLHGSATLADDFSLVQVTFESY